MADATAPLIPQPFIILSDMETRGLRESCAELDQSRLASHAPPARRHIVIVITSPSKETARLTRSDVCFCSFLTSLLVIVPLFGMIKRARLDAIFINIYSLIGMYCVAVLIILQLLKVT